LNSIEQKTCKPWAERLRDSDNFQSLWGRVTQLHIRGELEHPKLKLLKEILRDHFERAARAGQPSRAIVFTQLRASVSEIVGALVKENHACIKPTAFVGQSSGVSKGGGVMDGEELGLGHVAIKGQSQKEQKATLQKFISGEFNILVATSIAEEGLDVGFVDLIIMYDAVASPIRMIQRLGRTGRKRTGRCVMLLAEGSETNKYHNSKQKARSISNTLMNKQSSLTFYPQNHRMVPDTIIPTLLEQQVFIPEYHASQVGGRVVTKKKEAVARDRTTKMMQLLSDSQDDYARQHGLTATQCDQYSHFEREKDCHVNSTPTLQRTFAVHHSARSKLLMNTQKYIHDRQWEHLVGDATVWMVGETTAVNDGGSKKPKAATTGPKKSPTAPPPKKSGKKISWDWEADFDDETTADQMLANTKIKSSTFSKGKVGGSSTLPIDIRNSSSDSDSDGSIDLRKATSSMHSTRGKGGGVAARTVSCPCGIKCNADDKTCIICGSDLPLGDDDACLSSSISNVNEGVPRSSSGNANMEQHVRAEDDNGSLKSSRDISSRNNSSPSHADERRSSLPSDWTSYRSGNDLGMKEIHVSPGGREYNSLKSAMRRAREKESIHLDPDVYAVEPAPALVALPHHTVRHTLLEGEHLLENQLVVSAEENANGTGTACDPLQEMGGVDLISEKLNLMFSQEEKGAFDDVANKRTVSILNERDYLEIMSRDIIEESPDHFPTEQRRAGIPRPPTFTLLRPLTIPSSDTEEAAVRAVGRMTNTIVCDSDGEEDLEFPPHPQTTLQPLMPLHNPPEQSCHRGDVAIAEAVESSPSMPPPNAREQKNLPLKNGAIPNYPQDSTAAAVNHSTSTEVSINTSANPSWESRISDSLNAGMRGDPVKILIVREIEGFIASHINPREGNFIAAFFNHLQGRFPSTDFSNTYNNFALAVFFEMLAAKYSGSLSTVQGGDSTVTEGRDAVGKSSTINSDPSIVVSHPVAPSLPHNLDTVTKGTVAPKESVEEKGASSKGRKKKRFRLDSDDEDNDNDDISNGELSLNDIHVPTHQALGNGRGPADHGLRMGGDATTTGKGGAMGVGPFSHQVGSLALLPNDGPSERMLPPTILMANTQHTQGRVPSQPAPVQDSFHSDSPIKRSKIARNMVVTSDDDNDDGGGGGVVFNSFSMASDTPIKRNVIKGRRIIDTQDEDSIVSKSRPVIVSASSGNLQSGSLSKPLHRIRGGFEDDEDDDFVLKVNEPRQQRAIEAAPHCSKRGRDSDATPVDDKKRKKRAKKVHVGFFESQAELSGSDSGDEDMGDEDLDGDLEGFIDDGTQLSMSGSEDHTPLQAKYMKHHIDGASQDFVPAILRRGYGKTEMPVIEKVMQRMRDGHGLESPELGHTPSQYQQYTGEDLPHDQTVYNCDRCHINILGEFYTCKQCAPAFDLCVNCIINYESFHPPSHTFVDEQGRVFKPPQRRQAVSNVSLASTLPRHHSDGGASSSRPPLMNIPNSAFSAASTVQNIPPNKVTSNQGPVSTSQVPQKPASVNTHSIAPPPPRQYNNQENKGHGGSYHNSHPSVNNVPSANQVSQQRPPPSMMAPKPLFAPPAAASSGGTTPSSSLPPPASRPNTGGGFQLTAEQRQMIESKKMEALARRNKILQMKGQMK
jgi:superfamily II DNA/RNA helicase